MELAFPWPYSPGEWLAWAGAAFTALFGLISLFAPRLVAGPQGSRALGGFCAGVGLSAILFAQPLIYLALGVAWALAAVGQVISLGFDQGRMGRKLAGLVATLAMAILPLAFTLGYVP